jgi:hypothetical protein
MQVENYCTFAPIPATTTSLGFSLITQGIIYSVTTLLTKLELSHIACHTVVNPLDLSQQHVSVFVCVWLQAIIIL